MPSDTSGFFISDGKCKRCGKPFYEVSVATAIAVLVIGYLMIMFFFNLLYISEEPWVKDIFGDYIPLGLEYIALSVVLLIIMAPVMGAGIIPALKKRHSSAYGYACAECQKVLAQEAQDAAIKQRQSEEANAYAYMSKVEGLENGDPWLGKLIRSWKQENPNKLPEESMINDLVMAKNMEKAGNFEKAAVIMEKYRFWEEAGRMRRLDDQKVIKHITVDMNELIDQVGTKGLAIPYKCSSCGASITIDKDSKKEGLKFCSYCGTAYNIDDMTKIIQSALE